MLLYRFSLALYHRRIFGDFFAVLNILRQVLFRLLSNLLCGISRSSRIRKILFFSLQKIFCFLECFAFLLDIFACWREF